MLGLIQCLQNGPKTALKSHWNCSALLNLLPTALELHLNCSETALINWMSWQLPYNRTETALKLLCSAELGFNCPKIALQSHWNCTETACIYPMHSRRVIGNNGNILKTFTIFLTRSGLKQWTNVVRCASFFQTAFCLFQTSAWNCPETALNPRNRSNLTGTALKVLWNCSEAEKWEQFDSNCSESALKLHWKCSEAEK